MRFRFLAAILLVAPLYGSNNQSSVSYWSGLGAAHQADGKLSEAEQDYRRALAANQALASPSPQAAASLLNNLATIQQSRRDFKSAHALLQQGLTLLNENKLDRSNIAAPLLANLALNLQESGKLSEAADVYRQADEIFGRAGDTETPDYVLFLSNFGLLSFETGQFSAGMVQERRALAIQSKLPAATNLQKAYVRNNLALGLIQMGNLAEAKTCFLKAIELEGNGNPHIIETLSNLASLEEKTGNYAEAWTDETEAEQIAQKILPANEIGWATVRNNLGLIAFRRGDLHEAEREYEQAASLWLRTLGPDSPQYSSTLTNISALESARGHHKQAEETARQALTIDEAFFGPEHTRVAADLANLADEAFYRKKLKEAIELLLRAKEIEEKAGMINSLSLARIFDNLAAIYERSKQVTEARYYYEQAIRIYGSQEPNTVPSFAACLRHYAALLRELGDFANAEMVEVRATRTDVQSLMRTGTQGFH